VTEALPLIIHVATVRQGTLRTGRVVYHVHCSCSWRWPKSFKTKSEAEICHATRHAINGQLSADFDPPL